MCTPLPPPPCPLVHAVPYLLLLNESRPRNRRETPPRRPCSRGGRRAVCPLRGVVGVAVRGASPRPGGASIPSRRARGSRDAREARGSPPPGVPTPGLLETTVSSSLSKAAWLWGGRLGPKGWGGGGCAVCGGSIKRSWPGVGVVEPGVGGVHAAGKVRCHEEGPKAAAVATPIPRARDEHEGN